MSTKYRTCPRTCPSSRHCTRPQALRQALSFWSWESTSLSVPLNSTSWLPSHGSLGKHHARYVNSADTDHASIRAFARDGGLPFSGHFAKVHPTLRIPVNAVMLTSTICLLINIIPVGSTTAFYALTSLSTLALYFSYCVPATLIVIRKLDRTFPSFGPWKMKGGYWTGFAINVFACAWGWYCVFSLCLPTFMPVTAQTMNWAGTYPMGVTLAPSSNTTAATSQPIIDEQHLDIFLRCRLQV